MFKNKVLRKIFGAKRGEVTGEWRKLHNAELHALYSSPDIIKNIKSRRLRWAGHVARMGESRNAYNVSVGRPEGKRQKTICYGSYLDMLQLFLLPQLEEDNMNIIFQQDGAPPHFAWEVQHAECSAMTSRVAMDTMRPDERAAGVISGADPYRELELYLEKVNLLPKLHVVEKQLSDGGVVIQDDYMRAVGTAAPLVTK
ncbi:hypothetical protein ANN_18814 [Periplaneta americana]|uniref:Uncharacterized protein n=1 Tax=Periplaneta americana TaxID=6978 RepID=A0ABQ8SPT4_PERAM|nr:hypothetical protein ANN_18814 [Periplaneta americana]